MKYKVRDIVKIKAWDDMVDEFGIDDDSDINISPVICFAKDMEQYLQEKVPSRIVTIKEAGRFKNKYDFYIIEGTDQWHWDDSMIEELVEDSDASKFFKATKLSFIDMDK